MPSAWTGMVGVPAHRALSREWAETVAVGLIAALAILWFGQWLDNAHYSTTNGLWKSTLVTEWKANFHSGRIDASNYLYYPLTAALGRLLDLLGVHKGVAWQQLVVIDGLFAGLAMSFVYWLVRRLTDRRDIALFASLLHLGSAFFLSLAVSDEDILPSYTLVLVSMSMAAVWFAEPKAWHVACVSAFFTFGWLVEWRLMFPTLPPLLLALALSSGTLRRRSAVIALFLAVMVGLALLTAICWKNHIGSTGLDGILWTGKGVDTGWAGFSPEKLVLVAVGMGEYWLGGNNISSIEVGREWAGAFALELVLLALGLWYFWRRRNDPVSRTVAIVFIGTLGAGEFMNAYSQPSDPQMQINVMPWLTVVAALLLAELARGRGKAVVLLAIFIACLPLAYNVREFARLRGHDGAMMAEIGAIEKISPPAETVYLFAGFESATTWMFINWDQHWEGVCDVGPSPQPSRKFKWAALFGFLVHHPTWTQEQYLAAVKTEIECAFDKGYRVIASSVWNSSEQVLVDQMTPLGKKSFAPALRALLKSYPGTAVGDPKYEYYELKRR